MSQRERSGKSQKQAYDAGRSTDRRQMDRDHNARQRGDQRARSYSSSRGRSGSGGMGGGGGRRGGGRRR
ncbi:MAG: hypothetical protein JRF65_07065 [Deltaproteobacteria bacterium]|nr:hypothetical protein [Deltaproteobacteria bacterium]